MVEQDHTTATFSAVFWLKMRLHFESLDSHSVIEMMDRARLLCAVDYLVILPSRYSSRVLGLRDSGTVMLSPLL